ncbi:MAG TPA: hypothetical protein V6D10_22090 [Trichocoleus sp.]
MRGKSWNRREKVNVHDFADKKLGKTTPHRIDDVMLKQGWVSVGIDHHTAEFAMSRFSTDG